MPPEVKRPGRYLSSRHQSDPERQVVTAEGFPATPEAVAHARRFVAHQLPDLPRQSDLVLVVSELAANAVLHARTPFTVKLALTEEVARVEVSDQSPELPQPPRNRHGMGVLEVVADRWGVDTHLRGKTVWVEIDLADMPAGHDPRLRLEP